MNDCHAQDVQLQHEGLGPEGDPVFSAKITFRWMKGMRDHLSEK